MIKATLAQILGTYEPVLTDVLDAEGAVIGRVVAQGVAGVDWLYVASAIMLALAVYSVFRIVGGVILK